MSNLHVSSSPFNRLLRAATGLFVLLAALNLQAADTGRVAGSVVSKSTGNALQGALITIPELNLSTKTDNTGRYILHEVPVGEVEVTVSYADFSEKTQRVVVTAGTTATADFEMASSIVVMEAFTVQAEREGQALAETEQKNAKNIKNVVAIDAWGNLPNVSIGELAMRMPGVSVPSANGLDDDNVVMNVSIRGMDPNLTRLNIDGLPVSSVSGTGRTASLHSFTGAMYEQVEVTDGAMPDFSPDSIGGQLNLVTRSPLSMKEKRRVNYSAGLRWAPSFFYRTPERAQRNLHPSFNLSYREVFDVFGGHRNFGLAVNAYYSELVNYFDYQQFGYATTTGDVVPNISSYSATTGLNSRHYYSTSIRADYRQSDVSKYSFTFILNRGAEPAYDQTVVTATPSSIIAGYTDAKTSSTAGSYAVSTAHWSFYSINPTVTFRGDHKWDRLSIDYASRYSYMHYDSGSGAEGAGGNLSYTLSGVGMTLDRSNLDGPVFTQNSGSSVYNASSYSAVTKTFTKRDATVDQPEFIATLNGAYKFETRFPFELKSGANYRERIWNYQNRNPRQWTSTAAFTGYADSAQTAYEVRHGVNLEAIDPRSLSQQVTERADLWTENTYYTPSQKYTSRRHAKESISAAYVMGTVDINRLNLLGGVRFEHTANENWAYIKVASNTAVAYPDPVARAAADFKLFRNDGSYDKYYPSVHASYTILPELKARASWSTSFARAGFASLVPTLTVSDATQTITISNAGLKPQYSENIDLRLDYNFRKGGVITAGVFQKKITDYLLTQEIGTLGTGTDNGYDGSYPGYRVFQTQNAGDVTVKGLQLSYWQQLNFLPGLLKGLSLSANYTQLQTNGTFGGILSTSTALTTLGTGQVAGFTPKTGNASLGYTYRNFSTRLTASYTGDYISTFATAENSRLYREALTTYNLGFSYRLNSKVSLSCDIYNLTEEKLLFYRYIPSRVRESRPMASTVSFGINGQF